MAEDSKGNKPTKEQIEDARKYTKNEYKKNKNSPPEKYFEKPLRKSTFFQRFGAFFTGKGDELKQKDEIIDAIRDKIANNLANPKQTVWHEGIKSSYEHVNAGPIKDSFDKAVESAKKVAMKSDNSNYVSITEIPKLHAKEHNNSNTVSSVTPLNKQQQTKQEQGQIR